MTALEPNRRRKGRETQIEWSELRLHAPFLFLVGEGLLDTVTGRVGVIGKTEFVVFVVGHATPEADRVDHRTGRTPFAFAHQLGLMRVDPGVVVFAIDSGNVIKRIVLCEREAEKALIKNIRGAHRRPVAARRRIGLVAIEIAGLCRIGRFRRIRRRQIGITWDAIVLRCAAEGIGMKGKVSAARIEQRRAVKAAVDRCPGATELRTDIRGPECRSGCGCWLIQRPRRLLASRTVMWRARGLPPLGRS